jgi:hypothetical protein
MKFYFLILILTFFVFESAAQTTRQASPKIIEKTPGESCSLKLSDAPTLRGLTLEMPKAQVRKEYPAMIISTHPVISSGIALNNQISNPKYQEDIARVTVMFRNDKVFSILLTYTNSIRWNSIEEFADKVSESLNLPKATSRKVLGGAYYSINCGEFLVRTGINSEKQPTLLLTKDPDELNEGNQQKKELFKP